MSWTPIKNVKPGQRVSWPRSSLWSPVSRGLVVRVTKAMVEIKPDHGEALTQLRAGRDGEVRLSILTPDELAVEAWANSRPSTAILYMSDWSSLANARNILRVLVDDRALAQLDANDALRELCAEATLLMDWLASKPGEPGKPAPDGE